MKSYYREPRRATAQLLFPLSLCASLEDQDAARLPSYAFREMRATVASLDSVLREQCSSGVETIPRRAKGLSGELA